MIVDQPAGLLAVIPVGDVAVNACRLWKPSHSAMVPARTGTDSGQAVK
jgi:hypothetical protein